MLRTITACVGIVVVSFGAQAECAPMTLSLVGVNNSSVSASATFAYSAIDSTSATISISLTNTSTVTSSLTGLAFNAPSAVTGVTSLVGPAGWSAEFDPDGINTPGDLGSFGLAALTGPNFNGGKVAYGIAMGGTGLFSIGISGVNLDQLDELSFLSLVSALHNANTDPVAHPVAWTRDCVY